MGHRHGTLTDVESELYESVASAAELASRQLADPLAERVPGGRDIYRLGKVGRGPQSVQRAPLHIDNTNIDVNREWVDDNVPQA